MTQTPGPAPVGSAAPPVCPRHPDRESYVRCQRCERPTCPECQRPAAVGVQCVDCVREGARGQREARTAMGARLPARGRGRPVVTLTVIAACVLVYLVQLADPAVTRALLFAPVVAADQPYRFLTAAFLHGGWLHIAFNMYALYVVGPYLEAQLGRLRFAALYLVCAVGGSVGYLLLASPDGPRWMETAWYTGTVGASGAVFGLFGALLLVQRRLGQRSGQIVGLIVINAVIGFLPGSNIAWQAHAGGLVTGLLLGAVLAAAPQRHRTAVQVAGTTAVVLLLVAVTAAKLAASA